MKKIILFLLSVFVFLFVTSPSYAFQPGISGNFSASDGMYDQSTGSISFNYLGQDLSTCNAFAIYPYNSSHTTVNDYNSNNIFYDSGGPNHYILCASSSANGMLGQDNNGIHFTSTSSIVFLVRNIDGYYL